MSLLNFIFHTDVYLSSVISNYGVLTYLFLFGVIFIETGFVLTPFLPGDSLLFISGIFASSGALNLFFLFVLFSSAAILGDSLNYTIGFHLGESFFSKYIKQKNIDRTKKFFAKHGRRTIIFARFVPIVRTLAPFVAGVAKMTYSEFLVYNIVGGLAWVTLFLFAGYFFGTVPFVKNNLSVIIILIVFVSIIPLVIEYIKNKLRIKFSSL